MKGIGKETILKMLANRDPIPDARSVRILQGLLAECKELDPWMPIENAPIGRPIRLFSKVLSRSNTDGILFEERNRQFYSYWKELPEDPK